MQNKLICLVGMPGSGKSEVAEYLKTKHEFGYFRFGQIVLDKVKESGQAPSEKLEKEIRERIREEHGMFAMAILNLPKIESLIEAGDVIGDGLRSFEEYLFLKQKLGDNLVVIAVYTPPKLRHERLINRAAHHGPDANLKYRSNTKEEVWARDLAEIEGLHIGGTIAMADYTIKNISDIENLQAQVYEVLAKIFA